MCETFNDNNGFYKCKFVGCNRNHATEDEAKKCDGNFDANPPVVTGQPTKHDFGTCVLQDCHECNMELTDLLDIAGYFRKRGMTQNAELIHSAVMRLNLYSGTRLLMRVMGSKGGKKSKRKITPEQQAKMQAGRSKKDI